MPMLKNRAKYTAKTVNVLKVGSIGLQCPLLSAHTSKWLSINDIMRKLFEICHNICVGTATIAVKCLARVWVFSCATDECSMVCPLGTSYEVCALVMGRQQRLTRRQRNCGGGSSAIAAAAAAMYGRRRLTGKLSRIAGKGLLSLAVVISLD